MAKLLSTIFGTKNEDIVAAVTFFKAEENPQNPFELDSRWVCFLNENVKKNDIVARMTDLLRAKGFVPTDSPEKDKDNTNNTKENSKSEPINNQSQTKPLPIQNNNPANNINMQNNNNNIVTNSPRSSSPIVVSNLNSSSSNINSNSNYVSFASMSSSPTSPSPLLNSSSNNNLLPTTTSVNNNANNNNNVNNGGTAPFNPFGLPPDLISTNTTNTNNAANNNNNVVPTITLTPTSPQPTTTQPTLTSSNSSNSLTSPTNTSSNNNNNSSSEKNEKSSSTHHFVKGKGFINISIGFNRKSQRILQASYGPILRIRATDSREMADRIKRKQAAFQIFFREVGLYLAQNHLLHGQEGQESSTEYSSTSSSPVGSPSVSVEKEKEKQNRMAALKGIFPTYTKKDNPVKALAPIQYKKFLQRFSDQRQVILNLQQQIHK